MHKSIIALASVLAVGMLSGCTVQLQAKREPDTFRSGRRVHVAAQLDRGDFKLKNEGWSKVGQASVEGKGDVETIRVGAREGRFEQVLIVVDRADLQLFDVVVELMDGTTLKPVVNHRFRESSPSLAIDLPSGKRAIRRVTFRHGNLPGRGKAQVELWAR